MSTLGSVIVSLAVLYGCWLASDEAKAAVASYQREVRIGCSVVKERVRKLKERVALPGRSAAEMKR